MNFSDQALTYLTVTGRDKRGLVVSVYVAPGQEARAAEYEDQNLFE